MPPDHIRLNKLLAEQLGLSRREADAYINAGRVRINGAVAELGARVARRAELVTIDDKPLATKQKQPTYLMLHKPAGYVCSRRQQGDTPTIYTLLPAKYQALKPVGRLDKNSSGLLFLTNDGDFAHHMTHPMFQKRKVYYAGLDKPLEPAHQHQINSQGVSLADGLSKFKITQAESSQFPVSSSQNSSKLYKVEMSEGRNRQIRRTFGALGYGVISLHRTGFGSFALGALKEGSWQLMAPPNSVTHSS